MGMNASDRKKILALPFYLTKRHQLPEPRRGQHELEVFEELTGTNWFDDAQLMTDQEHKITEFDYEEHISPSILKNIDTQDAEFKGLVKALNYFSKTKYEKLQNDKENFK